MKWPHVAAKSRPSIAEALATVTPILVTTTRGRPEAKTLRAVLYGWAFHKANRESVQLGDPDGAALKWIRDHSLKVTTLDEKDRRSELIRPRARRPGAHSGRHAGGGYDHRTQAGCVLRCAELRRRAGHSARQPGRQSHLEGAGGGRGDRSPGGRSAHAGPGAAR